MKTWKVTAELDMCAEHYESVIIKANTKRKAIIFAEEYFKKNGAFFITNLSVEQIKT